MDTSEKARAMAKVRWGDKLTCRIADRQGARLAMCMWNGEKFEGRGKDNVTALLAVFKKINELGKKS